MERPLDVPTRTAVAVAVAVAVVLIVIALLLTHGWSDYLLIAAALALLLSSLWLRSRGRTAVYDRRRKRQQVTADDGPAGEA